MVYTIGMISILLGVLIGIRFLVFFAQGSGSGNVQSLILASMLIIIGVQTCIVGLQADVIAANRKILQDVQYKVRKLYYELESSKGDKE